MGVLCPYYKQHMEKKSSTSGERTTLSIRPLYATSAIRQDITWPNALSLMMILELLSLSKEEEDEDVAVVEEEEEVVVAVEEDEAEVEPS